jgi:hypothetical protein
VWFDQAKKLPKELATNIDAIRKAMAARVEREYQWPAETALS